MLIIFIYAHIYWMAVIAKDVNMHIINFNLPENKPEVLLRGLTYSTAAQEKGLIKKKTRYHRPDKDPSCARQGRNVQGESCL